MEWLGPRAGTLARPKGVAGLGEPLVTVKLVHTFSPRKASSTLHSSQSLRWLGYSYRVTMPASVQPGYLATRLPPSLSGPRVHPCTKSRLVLNRQTERVASNPREQRRSYIESTTTPWRNISGSIRWHLSPNHTPPGTYNMHHLPGAVCFCSRVWLVVQAHSPIAPVTTLSGRWHKQNKGGRSRSLSDMQYTDLCLPIWACAQLTGRCECTYCS